MRIRCLIGVIWLASAGPATAATVISYNDDATVIPPLSIGSVSVRPDSLVDVDSATLVLDGATSGRPEERIFSMEIFCSTSIW